MKTKTLDCVEMKRQGGLRVQEDLRGLTVEQQVAYWKKRAEEMLDHQRRLKEKARGAPPPR